MTLASTLVPITSIYIPTEIDKRIREKENLTKGITTLMPSIMKLGQLVPISVAPMPQPNAGGHDWYLLDGLTRLLALQAISFQLEQGLLPGQETQLRALGVYPGMVRIDVNDSVDPLIQLMIEYHANEDRQGWTWEENGRYVRRIHEMLVERHPDQKWLAEQTAAYINKSVATVSNYLRLTDPNDPATKDPKVKAAKTIATARKQLNIAKTKQRHIQQARLVEVKAEQVQKSVPQLESDELRLRQIEKDKKLVLAKQLLYPGDCREWIKTIPDNSLGWFHWDPPYGGAEGEGGAFASHAGIEEDQKYCLTLMQEMIPEIWRVLHDGAWLAIWYTPMHYQWLRMVLQGHVFNDEGTCVHCERNLSKDYIWLTENYSCRKSPHRFWVNPYPCVWAKEGFKADGHEIQRFLTKQTEYFLLAGKNHQINPVLINSSRGNIFSHPPVDRAERRHVHHKPPSLLSAILDTISVRGSVGGDASFGSGSIFEAVYPSGRKIVSAEKSTEFYNTGVVIASEFMYSFNVGTLPWLDDKMPEIEPDLPDI